VAYSIIAESGRQRLMGTRFTADTAYEALARVQRIRSRGFLVKISGPDGKPVSENDLEADAAGIRLLRLRPRATLTAMPHRREPPAGCLVSAVRK
jgi:hypothetical protein